jgi:hypothetical protein
MSEPKFKFFDENDGFMSKPYTLTELLELATMTRMAIDSDSDNGDFMDIDELRRGLRRGYIRALRYTGLKDKKGKEIYGGAIVKVKYNSGSHYFYSKAAEIFWSEYDASFCVRSRHCIDTRFTFMVARDSEVIGNVYEHPELIDGDNQTRSMKRKANQTCWREKRGKQT